MLLEASTSMLRSELSEVLYFKSKAYLLRFGYGSLMCNLRLTSVILQEDTSEEKFHSRERLTLGQLLSLTTYDFINLFLLLTKLSLNSPLTLASFQIILSDHTEQNINLFIYPSSPHYIGMLLMF